MIGRLDIENYRSIRSLSVEFAPLTVVTGPNGSGKSNLYKCLELLRAAADGSLSRRIADEGGMGSALWAGDPWRDEDERETVARARRKGPAQIKLAAQVGDLDYALTLGLPRPTDAALPLDPVVKLETVGARHGGKSVTMLERKGPALTARDAEGARRQTAANLWLFETALAGFSDPTERPELAALKSRLLGMRFYHDFPAGPASPLRARQPAIMTPMVESDGANWATAVASLQLIEADGMADSDFARAVAAAFPGGWVTIEERDGELSALLETAEFRRPFSARELSDGTLRYLALAAALSSLRLPSFMALNEPENSLHPSLIEPLAEQIGAAAARTQVLVVTHSRRLADLLEVEHAAKRLELRKDRGETVVTDAA